MIGVVHLSIRRIVQYSVLLYEVGNESFEAFGCVVVNMIPCEKVQLMLMPTLETQPGGSDRDLVPQ